MYLSEMYLLFKGSFMFFSDLSSNSSDDEPLIKAARHPQVTKILRIILERCDVEEAGATGSPNKTRTGTDYITMTMLL